MNEHGLDPYTAVFVTLLTVAVVVTPWVFFAVAAFVLLDIWAGRP